MSKEHDLFFCGQNNCLNIVNRNMLELIQSNNSSVSVRTLTSYDLTLALSDWQLIKFPLNLSHLLSGKPSKRIA